MATVKTKKDYEDLEDSFDRYMREGISIDKKEERRKKNLEKKKENENVRSR